MDATRWKELADTYEATYRTFYRTTGAGFNSEAARWLMVSMAIADLADAVRTLAHAHWEKK